MPDAVTHCFLAENVKNSLKISYLVEHFDVLQMGAQGPDPLFYYHYLPWKPNNGAKKLANRLHTESTKPYLELLVRSAKDDETKAWVAGFLTHFALDTVAHPYVFYKTGLFDPATQQYRGYHLMLERAIDNIYIKRRGYFPSRYNIRNRHFSRPSAPTNVITLLNDAGSNLYQAPNLGHLYARAYQDLRSAFRVLNFDPIGFKKFIFKLVDKVTKGDILFSALSAYNCILPGINYMNTLHKPWRHPSTNEEFTYSFDELFQIASDKAARLIQLAEDYYQTKNPAIFDAIEDQSYDTGLPCGTAPMKYFDIIFD
jgi:hypothetical protein